MLSLCIVLIMQMLICHSRPDEARFKPRLKRRSPFEHYPWRGFPKWGCSCRGNVLEYRGKSSIFGTVPLLPGFVPKHRIRNVWTTFVLVSSLVSTVHFGVLFLRVMALKPVQYGPA